MEWTSEPWAGTVISIALLLLGAAVGFYSNWLLENSKAKRALRERFLDQVLEYCAKVDRSADQLVYNALAYEVFVGQEPRVQARASELAQLDALHEDTTKAAYELREAQSFLNLIAPTRVKDTSAELYRAASDFVARWAAGTVDIKQNRRVLNDLTQAFRVSVRTEFGVNDKPK